MLINNILNPTFPDSSDRLSSIEQVRRDIALDELILARATGMLATCHLLARDEVQLIGVVINNLDADPDYQPSDTMMTAIQRINRKFASCRVQVLT